MERLQEALNLNSGEQFFILYGSGIADSFITPDYMELNCEQTLNRLLQDQGFERIVFVSPSERGVYFWDHKSHRLTHPTEGARNGGVPSTNTSTASPGFQGPLGSFMTITPPEIVPQVPSVTSTTMSDTHMVGLIDAIMKDVEGPRSAIIIQQAETSVEFFQNQRTLAGRIGSWSGLRSKNQNICFWLFSVELLRDLQAIVYNLPIPELRTHLKSASHIGGPRPLELSRLVDYARLTFRFTVDWTELSRLVPQISATGIGAKAWLRQLRQIDCLNRALAVRCGWISGSTDGRSATERLNERIGLDRIKEVVEEQVALHARRSHITEIGGDVSSVIDTPHLIFTGSPGTGKTTIAELMGEIYADAGRLARGHVHPVKVEDLVDRAVGGTPIKTGEEIDKALDGILFIDEAYRLIEPGIRDFGQLAINTLLDRMENERDRLMVIAAGYPQAMKEFRNSNVGLVSRFPEENIIHFPDYNPAELTTILHQMLSERHLFFDPDNPEMENMLRQIVDNMHAMRDETFGNAREMRNLADALFKKHSLRLKREGLPPDAPLHSNDIPETYASNLQPTAPAVNDLLCKLDRMVGLESVKQFVRELLALLEDECDSQNPSHSRDSLHMVFIGNPGTGKTSVAELMGLIFKELGLLRKGHTVKAGKEDLVGQVLGETEAKTAAKIKEALDGVLFIDEAYALTQEHERGYGQTAVNVLVPAMENHRDRLVVIVAGYQHEMANFLSSNSGLPSRFTKYVEFPDYTSEELLKILRDMAEPLGYVVPIETAQAVAEHLEAKRNDNPRFFDNARAVRTLFGEMRRQRAWRVRGNANGTESRQAEPADKTAAALRIFVPSDVPQYSAPISQLGTNKASQHSLSTRQSQPVRSSRRNYDLSYDLESILPSVSSLSSMVPPELEATRQAVGCVSVRLPNGQEGSGTGFVVTPDGHFLTSFHIVEMAEAITVQLDGSAESLTAQLVGWNRAVDLAILRLVPGEYQWLPLAQPEGSPAYSEAVGVWGYPLGAQFSSAATYATGHISNPQYTGPNGVSLIQIDVNVNQGNSGGPLFRSTDRHVIGVIYGGVSGEIASGLNFAVEIQNVYRCFGQNQ